MAEKNFQPEKNAPGAEIEYLKERIGKLEAQLKKEQPAISPEKEPFDAAQGREKAVKQEIKSYLSELQQTPVTAAPLATRDEADEIKKLPANQQVGALISLVFEKGLEQAISVARELNNPAILDEFHDLLTDRYYKELSEGKIVK
jgi:chromosome segregation ATPase